GKFTQKNHLPAGRRGPDNTSNAPRRDEAPMRDTPVSLLERLRLQPDAAAWQRLADLYAPLIRTWLRRHSVQPSDADDLVQEVLGVLVRELPDFQHQRRPGAFRRWLRGVTVNRLRVFWRSQRGRPAAAGGSDFEQALAQLEDP